MIFFYYNEVECWQFSLLKIIKYYFKRLKLKWWLMSETRLCYSDDIIFFKRLNLKWCQCVERVHAIQAACKKAFNNQTMVSNATFKSSWRPLHLWQYMLCKDLRFDTDDFFFLFSLLLDFCSLTSKLPKQPFNFLPSDSVHVLLITIFNSKWFIIFFSISSFNFKLVENWTS